ncbi:peptidylprolyl isomerase [Campylobacter mucosalis]|uniref:Putative SurA domain protein n=1 Tax=Campylobacter mucosalis CCUG 21559 TaxID=1032067 RepID=A0A6G5QEZ4_9BACT|nr:peptidylprolyl isomerase [Campylobacter mucosalis]QCD44221.1 putative SurA domain protein [Campylobacter mucosalis CCUG 21559]
MVKKAIFASLVCGICLNAQMVNGIAAIVENEPITLFEVSKVKEQLKISEQKALDLLVRDRLEQAQIKALGISVTPFEVNERVESLAKNNGLTNSEFRSQIEQKGVKFSDFKSDIEKNLLQEKLYKNIFANVGKNINEDTARRYFLNNRAEFSTFKSISVVLFSADDPNLLVAQKNAGIKPIAGVKTKVLNLSYENISPRLAVLLSATPEQSFTQPLQGQNSFDMFYVNSKNGSYTPEFEDIKDEVLNALYTSEQEKVAQDYFDKLRAKAKINMIRQPQ